MKIRRFLTYVIAFLLSIGISFPALADKEHIQSVLKKADNVEKKAMNVLEDGQRIYRAGQKGFNGVKKSVNSAMNVGKAIASGDIEGAFSAATDFADSTDIPGLSENLENIQTNVDEAGKLTASASALASKANGLIKTSADLLPNTVPNYLTDTTDIKQTEADVEKEYTSVYGNNPDIDVFTEQQDKLMSAQRENIANLYAKALAVRVDIADEKAATPVEIDSTTARSLINATRDTAMRTAVRLKRIYELEAAMYEYNTTAQTQRYMIVNQGDSSAASDTSGEQQ